MRYAILILFFFVANTIWSQEFNLYPFRQHISNNSMKQIVTIDSANYEKRILRFNQEGQLLSNVYYQKNKLYDSIVNYFDNGNKIRTNHYGDQRTLVRYEIFEYDRNKILVRKNCHEGKFSEKKKFKYHNGKLIEVKEKNNFARYTDKYSYTDKGLTTMRKFYKGVTLVKVGNMFKSDTLEYGEHYTWQIDSTIPKIKAVVRYDNCGRKLERLLYNDGKEIDKTLYFYHNDLLIAEELYSYGKLIWKFFFDERGNMICAERNNKIKISKYEYNLRGDWTKRYYYDDDQLKNIVSREIQYWD